MSDVNTTGSVDPSVLRRVQSLLNLARDGGATEHEALLAMQRAQEIMAKHGLDTATIEASGGQGETRVKNETEGGAREKWQPGLMRDVCESCFVSVRIVRMRGERNRKPGAGYEVIGRASAVATARVMFDYLCHTVVRLDREQVHVEQFGSRFFRRGMAERLGERLRTRHEEMLRRQKREAEEAQARARHPSAATGTALVVVLVDYAAREADLNEDMKWGRPPGTTERQRAEYEQRGVEREKQQAARIAALMADGISESVAEDMVLFGWSQEKAQKPETEAEQRRRQERSRREDERYWRRHEKESAKRQSRAWQAGRRVADDVSLEPQLDNSSKGRRLS